MEAGSRMTRGVPEDHTWLHRGTDPDTSVSVAIEEGEIGDACLGIRPEVCTYRAASVNKFEAFRTDNLSRSELAGLAEHSGCSGCSCARGENHSSKVRSTSIYHHCASLWFTYQSTNDYQSG